jgi:hydrogenase expression/formation protein HypC
MSLVWRPAEIISITLCPTGIREAQMGKGPVSTPAYALPKPRISPIIRFLYPRQESHRMCLGIPAKVIEVSETRQGRADYLGTKVKVNFALLESVEIGDWVIIHAGYAISRLNEEEAQETLSLLREYLEQNET